MEAPSLVCPLEIFMFDDPQPEMLLNPFGTEFALLQHEFGALVTMLRRAVTKNDKALYQTLARDLLRLLDEWEDASFDEDRRRAKAKAIFLQGVAEGMKQ